MVIKVLVTYIWITKEVVNNHCNSSNTFKAKVNRAAILST